MLAEVDDVKQFLNKSGNAEDSVIKLLLEGVSAQIEGEVGFAIEQKDVTEILQSAGFVGLVLSNPVFGGSDGITSIKEDTLTLATTDWRLEGRTLQRLSDGLVGSWPRVDVTVVYKAGFQDVPNDLRMAAVQQTAFEYKQTVGGGGRLGLSSDSPSQGGESLSYIDHDLLPGVLRTLRRHRSVY